MSKKNLRLERERHRREENRHSILRAAEKVFIQKGYRLATVDDIAEEAQFSKATLYRYFKSKHDIFFEIIFSSFEESYTGMQNIQKKNMSAEEKLKELIGFIITTYHKKKNLSRIFFMEKATMRKILSPGNTLHGHQADVHANIPARFKSKMKQISAIMSEIIREGVDKGEFRDMDIQDASIVLGSLLRGFYFHGPIPVKEYTIQETTDLLHSFFLNGIKKRPQPKKGD
jgi:AcrR family transcriptional regulator